MKLIIIKFLYITYKQATLIGDGGGIFGIPPSAKKLENTPSKFLEFKKTGKN